MSNEPNHNNRSDIDKSVYHEESNAASLDVPFSGSAAIAITPIPTSTPAHFQKSCIGNAHTEATTRIMPSNPSHPMANVKDKQPEMTGIAQRGVFTGRQEVDAMSADGRS